MVILLTLAAYFCLLLLFSRFTARRHADNETFYRGKTHSGEGTGLGLALVHAIVSSYGGSISLESKPDAGTTFRVTL